MPPSPLPLLSFLLPAVSSVMSGEQSCDKIWGGNVPWARELKHEHGSGGLTDLRLHRHVSYVCTRYIKGFCVRTTVGRSDRNVYRLSASEKIDVSFAVVQSVVQSL